MTGPEHFTEAERLLHVSDIALGAADYDHQAAATDIAQAQVHATLALIASIAEIGGLIYDENQGDRVTAWEKAVVS